MCSAIAEDLDKHLKQLLVATELASADIGRLQASVDRARHLLDGTAHLEAPTLLAVVVTSISVEEDRVTIICTPDAINPLLDGPVTLLVPLPLGCVRTRKRERMVIAGNDAMEADPATVRLLARAFAARRTLLDAPNLDAAAASLGYSRDYVIALAKLSYLAPSIVTAMLDGEVDGSKAGEPLTRIPLPLG